MIAKLDRRSRNAAFVLTLRESGVRFVAVGMPEANDLTVGIMALVVQAEREAISRRTKEALAAADGELIRRWHVQDRGWRDIGYHWVINRDGSVAPGRPESSVLMSMATTAAPSGSACSGAMGLQRMIP